MYVYVQGIKAQSKGVVKVAGQLIYVWCTMFIICYQAIHTVIYMSAYRLCIHHMCIHVYSISGS